MPYQEQPVGNSGNMLLKRDLPTGKPIDCMRVMMEKTRECPVARINNPQDAVNLMKEMGNYDRERATILHLSTKNDVIGVENISIGSLDASIVHPREALKGAILVSASKIMFVHNHPSGDPAPSVEDRNIHKKLITAFDTVGIQLLDSIIIGRDTYYSFKESGEDFKTESGGMKIMERKDKKTQLEDDDESCEVAMEAAYAVVSERCQAGKKINNAIQAANAAVNYLVKEKGKPVLSREVQRIYKIDDDTWEIGIEGSEFTGTIKISAGKPEIIEE
jgi:DNA repair protein RadC